MKLPQGWAEAKLGDLSSKVGSGATPRGGREAYGVEGTPLIRSMNVHFDGFRSDGLAFIDDRQANALAKVEVNANDVLLNITGASIGRVCLAPDDMAGARVNQHVCIIRLIEVEQRFIHAFLAAPDMQRFVLEENYGLTRQALTKGMIEDIIVPLPPLAEQRRIVAKLDALTARLARARAELDRVPVLAANLRRQTLRDAFAQGTQTVPIGDLIADIRYGTAKKCDYGGGAVPVLRIPNVQGGRINLGDMKSADFDPKELTKLTLRQGDILVIRSNGSLDLVGRSAVVDDNAAGMLFAGYLIRMRAEPAKCLPEYLHHFLQSPAARDTIRMAAKSTSGVNNVNAQQLQALAVPLPDLATQQNLISQIEQSFARADRLEAEATRARALLDRLESALLAKGFRGELVLQDPTDEPAQTLLDRIRTQRAAAPKAKRGPRAKELA